MNERRVRRVNGRGEWERGGGKGLKGVRVFKKRQLTPGSAAFADLRVFVWLVACFV